MQPRNPEFKGTMDKPPLQLVFVLEVTLASESQRNLLSALTTVARPDALPSPLAVAPIPPGQGAWLALKDAAQYIGVSTSTLYKYASQRRIESRKLAGRLQFRRSLLDRFIAEQVRPARPEAATQGIIQPALGSGK